MRSRDALKLALDNKYKHDFILFCIIVQYGKHGNTLYRTSQLVYDFACAHAQ